MRKQTFEVLPSEKDLPGLYEILRYENATQRAEIASQEQELEKLKTLVDELEQRLDTQQQVIDLCNAEIRRLRAD